MNVGDNNLAFACLNKRRAARLCGDSNISSRGNATLTRLYLCWSFTHFRLGEMRVDLPADTKEARDKGADEGKSLHA